MKRLFWIVITTLLGINLLLSACAPISSIPTPDSVPTTVAAQTPSVANLPTETPSAFAKYQIPVYYPETYISIVEASKNETGLVIYSMMTEENWKPILETFNAHYPWIKVTVQDLDAAEVFTRYYGESEQKTPSADIVVSSDPINWFGFFDKKQVLPYKSQEDSFIPDWSKSSYGTYTVSSDPMVIIYNKKLIGSAPESMADIVSQVKADPAGFKNQIVTYDAELNPTGFAINWFWIDLTNQDGWSNLETLGKTQLNLMTSDSQMVDAVGKGQARLGYFVSTTTLIPRLKTYPDLGWSYMKDGQPILLRNMAITQNSVSPNSAKMMLDFILSQEGQYALALGGLTPYRSDISEITDYHFDKISSGVGEDNLIMSSFDARLLVEDTRNSFINNKWKTAIGKKDNPPGATPTP